MARASLLLTKGPQNTPDSWCSPGVRWSCLAKKISQVLRVEALTSLSPRGWGGAEDQRLSSTINVINQPPVSMS